MLKKTIKINPELFNIGDKTRKIREKKQRPSMPLVVKPNSLKKELLNRIKSIEIKRLNLVESLVLAMNFMILLTTCLLYQKNIKMMPIKKDVVN